MIDMKVLATSGQPDAHGHAFKPAETVGSAIIRNAAGERTGVTLVVAGGTYNPETATCGTTCVSCCGYNGFLLTPSSFFCPVGWSMQCGPVTGTDCNGHVVQLPVSSWSTNNSSVATINSSGLMEAIAVGSVNISATLDPIVATSGTICFSGGTAYCPTETPTVGSSGSVAPQLELQGKQYNSIFVGTDPNLAPANSIFATVNPTGGTFTETSSASGDTFTNVASGGPGWVVHTNTQSAGVDDRTIMVTYTLNGISVSKSLSVTAREFAYANNNSPGNICSLGHGYYYNYWYTPYTHPDKTAVQAGIGVDGTSVTESFNPKLPSSDWVTGSGALDGNSQFTDRIEICSNSTLSISTTTTTQTISIEGHKVRQNSLKFSDSGLTYTNEGPTQ